MQAHTFTYTYNIRKSIRIYLLHNILHRILHCREQDKDRAKKVHSNLASSSSHFIVGICIIFFCCFRRLLLFSSSSSFHARSMANENIQALYSTFNSNIVYSVHFCTSIPPTTTATRKKESKNDQIKQYMLLASA